VAAGAVLGVDGFEVLNHGGLAEGHAQVVLERVEVGHRGLHRELEEGFDARFADLPPERTGVAKMTEFKSKQG